MKYKMILHARQLDLCVTNARDIYIDVIRRCLKVIIWYRVFRENLRNLEFTISIWNEFVALIPPVKLALNEMHVNIGQCDIGPDVYI